MTSRYDVISKPDIVTCREIIEWAVARPSRVIKINRAFGKSSMRYFVDFNVNGSFSNSKMELSQSSKVSPTLSGLPGIYAQEPIGPSRARYLGVTVLNEMASFLSFSFVTKSLSGFSVLHNNFKNKFGYGRVNNRFSNASFI